MSFSKIERDPVAAGMGFAGAASARDVAWSAFGNSAAIPFYSGTLDAGAVFHSWAPDAASSDAFSLGAALRTSGQIGLSLGMARHSFERYDIVDDYGVEDGTFKPSAMVVNGGAGYRFSENFGGGVNLRYMRQKNYPAKTDDAFAVDVMFHYKPLPDLAVTAGIFSIGSGVKSAEGEKSVLPSSVKVAGDYAYASGDHSFRGDLDLEYFFAGSFSAAVGVQYGYKGLAFLRGGWHYGAKDGVLPSFASIGAGCRLYGVKVDVAYITANKDIGGSLVIGLGYTF